MGAAVAEKAAQGFKNAATKSQGKLKALKAKDAGLAKVAKESQGRQQKAAKEAKKAKSPPKPPTAKRGAIAKKKVATKKAASANAKVLALQQVADKANIQRMGLKRKIKAAQKAVNANKKRQREAEGDATALKGKGNALMGKAKDSVKRNEPKVAGEKPAGAKP